MKSTKILLFIIIVTSLLPSLRAGDDILGEKSELKRIEQTVLESKARLDSLQAAEHKLQKRIANRDQKISSDRMLIGRLSRELRQLKKKTSLANSGLEKSKLQLDRSRRRYLGNIRQFYLSSQRQAPIIYGDPNAEVELQKQVIYLTAVASFQSKSIERASELLGKSVLTLNVLRGKKGKVTKMKKEREVGLSLQESQKRLGERNLNVLQRKSRQEVDHIMTLEAAAEEIESIIALLEEQRERQILARKGAYSASVFAGLKGQLRSPFQGKIVKTYGIHTDPVTKLKSFSPGVVIKGRPGAKVYCVASGTVAYAGNLRGYGEFVIIQHDNQYYTMYAGLGRYTVSLDQRVQARYAIGLSASDGLVKFELRMGKETLDPVQWLNIESL